MTKSKTISPCGRLAALLLSIVGLPAAAHAVGFTMTPASVAADYTGTITLDIAGVSTGQTVVVETFLDTNGNGAVDGGELLVQSFQVTDGQALVIGGKRNTNVPGDDDGSANGNIVTQLRFQALAEIPKAVGTFVYRVSPATSGFTPIVFPFSVTQPDYPQQVVGQVNSGGLPVPFAYAFLITPTSDGPVFGALADAGGNFTLNAAADSYMLGAVKDGFSFNFGTAPQVMLSAGATAVQNVSLAAANRTISGRITDSQTGAGLAGVQMTAESSAPDLISLVFTDTDGNFNISVSNVATQWLLYPAEKSVALLGYLLASDGYPVETAGGNVSGVSIPLPKATALIWGNLHVDQGPPLPDIGICADNSGQYESCVVSDSGGDYIAGVLGGTWNVYADSDALAALGYVGQGARVGVGTGQALQQDLVARHPTAHLAGRMVDDSIPANAIADACISAFPDQGETVAGRTDGDGNFSLGVVAGTWHLGLCSEDAQQRGLVPSLLSFSVTDGSDITGIQYVAKQATALITGHLQDNDTVSVAGVGVFAQANVGGISYGSWQQTDAGGNFSLGVFNGSWEVYLSCNDLSARGYSCPAGQFVTVSGSNQVANFTVQPLAPCVGDCDENGQVTVDEILAMLRIALGDSSGLPCPAGDADKNGQITVDEIITAVHHALNGCGQTQ